MTDGVVLYIRVRSKDQDLAGQERKLREYAQRSGWRAGRVYAEKVSAGGRVEREQHAKLLTDARDARRRWRRVLFWALDRWSRDPSFVKAIGSIEELEASGVQIHSLTEPYIDSSEDGSADLGRDLLRCIQPTIASFEPHRRAERTQFAMD